ncbi:MAG: glycosyltransferase family 39 protein [Bacteroidota bacterium]|nr:glycosyltransferase family 39 protein [Bacteroidota bacterium]
MAFEIASFRKLFAERGWKSLIILSFLISGIRFVSIGVMGIMPQDAYYDFYARHLALSYYDHPPMIAYLLRLFTVIFGNKVFALKLADTTITLLTLFAFYRLSKKFLSENKARIATTLLLSTIMISILSLISTPDVPLMLCWTISLNFLYEAVLKKRKIYWVWAGIMAGLSFDSKYTAVFLMIGLIGFLLMAKSYRKLLFSRWLYLYLLCFIVTILPVFIWNFGNGFASFKFQSEGRVKEGLQFDPGGFAGVVGHQSAILLPFLFFSLVYFIYRICRKYGFRFARIPVDQLFLLCFFIPIFLGFFSISFFYWVKINWMMPAYITGIIWVCRFWNTKWLKYQLIFSLVLHIALAIEVIFYVVPIRSDDTWFGWRELSFKVEVIRKHYPNAFIFSSDDYKTSAVLNFFMNEMVYSKNVVGQRALQFDFIGTDLKRLNGLDAIFIDSNPRFDDLKNEKAAVPSFYYSYFDSIIPLEPILIDQNGHTERKFSVYLCRNYHSK